MMPYAIKYRRLERRSGLSTETLAVDIESHREATQLVGRLADSFPHSGRYLPPARWFRSDEGLHIIWVQPY